MRIGGRRLGCVVAAVARASLLLGGPGGAPGGPLGGPLGGPPVYTTQGEQSKREKACR